MKPRSIAEICGILALVLLLFTNNCTREQKGKLEERAKTLATEAKQADKRAKVWQDSASAERKLSESLLKALNNKDSLLKDKAKSFSNTRRAYDELRAQLAADTVSDPIADAI